MNEKPTQEIAVEESPLNEAADLQLEDSRARYDERMAELDRRDRAGPHYRWRD